MANLFVSFLLVAVSVSCLIVGLDGRSRKKRTINTDSRYQKFSSTLNFKTAGIPYCIDTDYSPSEANQIRLAISQVIQEINFCVIFTELQSCTASTAWHLRFTSASTSVCYAYPGALTPFSNSGEQIVSITRGATGCLDGTMHSIKKYIVILLGKRLECNRADRDSYITVNNANVAIAGAYTPYVANTQAYWNLMPFTYDYCSITHNQPSDYANSGTQGFVVNPANPLQWTGPIPKLETISLMDCQWIATLNNCSASACKQAPCVPTSTSVGPTTTAMGTTGTGSTTTGTTNTASTTTGTTNTGSTTTGTTGITTTNTGSTTTGTTGSTTTGSTGSTTTGTTGSTTTGSTGSTTTGSTGSTTTGSTGSTTTGSTGSTTTKPTSTTAPSSTTSTATTTRTTTCI